MRKIIFIPTTFYLSDSYFILLASQLNKDYECYYVDPCEITYQQINIENSQKLEALRKNFKSIIRLNPYPATPPHNLFQKCMNFHKHFKQLGQVLNNINPSLIIMTSDGTLTARYLKKFKPNCPIIILQTAFINFSIKNKNKTRSFLKSSILKIINPFTYPYTSINQLFGLTLTNCHLFLWGESSATPYLNKKNTKLIHITGNPLMLPPPSSPTNWIEKKILCLVGHETSKDKQIEHYLEFKKIIDTFPNYHFIVRNHPAYKDDINFPIIFSGNIKIIIDDHRQSVSDLIQQVDLVITSFSCSSIEALFFNKQVLHLRKQIDESLQYWFETAPIPYFANSFDLIKHLNNQNFDLKTKDVEGAIQKYIKWIWEKTGPNSLQSTVDAINNIIN